MSRWVLSFSLAQNLVWKSPIMSGKCLSLAANTPGKHPNISSKISCQKYVFVLLLTTRECPNSLSKLSSFIVTNMTGKCSHVSLKMSHDIKWKISSYVARNKTGKRPDMQPTAWNFPNVSSKLSTFVATNTIWKCPNVMSEICNFATTNTNPNNSSKGPNFLVKNLVLKCPIL